MTNTLSPEEKARRKRELAFKNACLRLNLHKVRARRADRCISCCLFFEQEKCDTMQEWCRDGWLFIRSDVRRSPYAEGGVL